MSKLYVIGVGPGSKDYITKIAIDKVKKADIVIGSKRALDLFDEFNETNEKIEFNVKNLHKHLEESVLLAKSGKEIALLSTGDPGFSGLLKPILKIAKEKELDEKKIEVIPGVSSLQLSAAKTHISWEDANIISFHGRENQKDILKIINNKKPTIALPSKSVKDFAKFLIDSGADKRRKVTICERLSYDNEKVVETTLNDLRNSDFTYMCIMVIYPEN
ncbi:MAG: cobalt-precorrin-7 (C(5))-methyltransferase [Methanobrevibacter sp.]|jgi:cobalt-precorrin-7 (C5)-methyltransferase|nr:cobalt-precorrin-7 (C(5))-methyltransferase [Methanobrevibacter sp.]